MNGDRPSAAVVARRGSRPDRSAGQRNQVGDVAAVERQLEDALVFHDLTDADVPGFHQRRAGLDLHRLGKLAKLEDDVDGGTAIDLQHDAGLHIRPEPRQRRFQSVRANGQIRQHIGAPLIRDRGAHDTGVRLRHGDVNAR